MAAAIASVTKQVGRERRETDDLVIAQEGHHAARGGQFESTTITSTSSTVTIDR